MAYKEKIIKAKSAVKSRSNLDLSHHHLTTMDFGQLIPIDVYHEVLPGDSYRIGQSVFARVAPLAVPTYGNCFLKTATFFVPYHQVANDVESWLAGDKYYNGQISMTRSLPYGVLIGLFLGQTYFDYDSPQSSSLVVSNSPLVTCVNRTVEELIPDYYDFCIRKDSTHVVYYTFTAVGRYWYKILRSLGYGFLEGMDIQTTSEFSKAGLWSTQINLLPLLSYLKAYNDWMSQSALYNRSQLSSFLNTCRYSWNTYDHRREFVNDLQSAFSSVRVPYESNYFTTAWQSPNEIITGQGYNDSMFSPNSGLNSVDLGTYKNSAAQQISSELVVDENYTGIHGKAGTINQQLSGITALGIKFLNAMDSYLRRNNYSGARNVEKLLSRFGVKVEDYRNDFTILLDTSKSILNIGDVTNTTDFGPGNEDHALGSYAGKGIISGDNKVEFKSSDFGTIITLAWIQPDIQYYEGIDRTIFKTHVSDFYQPEFDGLTASPIAQFEFGQNPKSLATYKLGNKVFGFTERYNEMRTPRSRVTGDFALDENMSSWHFGWNGQFGNKDFYNYSAQSEMLMSQEQAYSQYDRIFVDETDTATDMRDHFYMTCYFDVNASRPMMSTSEVAGLGDGHLNIQRNGTQMG